MSDGETSDRFAGYTLYGHVSGIPARFGPRPGRVPVLLYHSVSDIRTVERAGLFNVTPSTLTAQLEWLKDRGFETITPARWAAWRLKGQPLPRRPVLLAFDDGFRNNAETALPLLLRLKMKAAFFVASSFLDGMDPFPWVQGPGREAFLPMTADHVRELHARGMTVGAHSHTHRRLNSLSDPEAFAEIRESKTRLENVLNDAVTTFAYPYGSKWDLHPRHQALCEQAGMETAFTTQPVSSNRRSDRFAIPRLTVYERDGIDLFKLKALGWFDAYDAFRRILLIPRRSGRRKKSPT